MSWLYLENKAKPIHLYVNNKMFALNHIKMKFIDVTKANYSFILFLDNRYKCLKTSVKRFKSSMAVRKA